MWCKKCGHENEDNAKFCDSCGIELVNTSKISSNTGKGINLISGSVAILGGFISSIGSYKMTQIKSVSGNSIAESFYSSFGVFGIGFGIFMIAVGIYIISHK